MAVVSNGQLFCRRAETLQMVCEEVKKYLYNRCFDEHVNPDGIDFFTAELFKGFIKEKEMNFLTLLSLLNSSNFLEESFRRYQII